MVSEIKWYYDTMILKSHRNTEYLTYFSMEASSLICTERRQAFVTEVIVEGIDNSFVLKNCDQSYTSHFNPQNILLQFFFEGWCKLCVSSPLDFTFFSFRNLLLNFDLFIIALLRYSVIKLLWFALKCFFSNWCILLKIPKKIYWKIML